MGERQLAKLKNEVEDKIKDGVKDGLYVVIENRLKVSIQEMEGGTGERVGSKVEENVKGEMELDDKQMEDDGGRLRGRSARQIGRKPICGQDV